jgi:threonyl-tRNA synthetase
MRETADPDLGTLSRVSEIRLTVDRSPIVVPAGATAGQAFGAAEIKGVVAVRAGDGTVKDLAYHPEDGEVVESITANSDEGRAIIRHSTAHVMAQAVQALFPGAKLGIGPPITNGFYYDFDVERPFTPDDVAIIEKRMKAILKERQRFHRRVVSDEQARTELAAEPYKLELIGLKGAPGSAGMSADEAVETGGSELTIYDNLRRKGDHSEVAWKDLCRGPHVPHTGYIPAFKLMRTAAAYWRGDEHNPQLQRIYGTAWESKEALEAHLTQLAEAEKRDHRRLGTELDLFSFPGEIGAGLAVWHPKGGLVRRVMEEYSRVRHEEAGYSFVTTPHLAKETLFQTSGHLQWYRDGMYPPMEMDGARYYLKPMNCPMHILIYQARGKSYRELPQRYFEFGTVYRFEKSGVLHGLTRIRGFTQDDSHIFCTPDQLSGELVTLLDFILSLLRDFGLTEFEAELATRPDKFVGEPEEWDTATEALRNALEIVGLSYVVAEGEGAFYAPKVDVHVRDAIGRRWQMSTLQVDLQFPTRFDLEYQAADGTRKRPCMIHRALFGSVERFLAILLEHYAGALPPWLSPVQVVGVPIAERHVSYLEDVAARLRAAGARVEVDSTGERMQKKIARAQAAKVPFMLLAGDDDVDAGLVSLRLRNGTERRGVPVDEVVAEVLGAIAQPGSSIAAIEREQGLVR